MEIFTLENDINVFCVTAKSFPEGIAGAFEQLNQFAAITEKRRLFGISCPNEKGNIIYRAALEVLHNGEAQNLELESLVIPKGSYVFTDIVNFHDHLESISAAFQQLISNPNIDPNGQCIEWYINNKDVRCMVKLAKNS